MAIIWTEEMDTAVTRASHIKTDINELAKSLGISRYALTEHARKLGVKLMQKDAWSEEDILTLRSEWDQGSTGSQIGALLGMTRNAIIGKAHRLGLERRWQKPRDVNRPRAPRKPRVAKPIDKAMTVIKKKGVAPRFYPAAVPLTDKAPISIMGLNSATCHAIVGHGSDGLAVYCGDFTFADKPYCEGHCAMYYQPPDARRRLR